MYHFLRHRVHKHILQGIEQAVFRLCIPMVCRIILPRHIGRHRLTALQRHGPRVNHGTAVLSLKRMPYQQIHLTFHIVGKHQFIHSRLRQCHLPQHFHIRVYCQHLQTPWYASTQYTTSLPCGYNQFSALFGNNMAIVRHHVVIALVNLSKTESRHLRLSHRAHSQQRHC